MDNYVKAFAAVLAGIIGAAIVAVLVSKNAQTAGVIGAAGTVFTNSLEAAVSPVTGTSPALSNTGSFGFGSGAITPLTNLSSGLLNSGVGQGGSDTSAIGNELPAIQDYSGGA
jgi:PRD1 phage membrane DNA delivery